VWGSYSWGRFHLELPAVSSVETLEVEGYLPGLVAFLIFMASSASCLERRSEYLGVSREQEGCEMGDKLGHVNVPRRAVERHGETMGEEITYASWNDRVGRRERWIEKVKQKAGSSDSGGHVGSWVTFSQLKLYSTR
jgi:hypothetical protein